MTSKGTRKRTKVAAATASGWTKGVPSETISTEQIDFSKFSRLEAIVVGPRGAEINGDTGRAIQMAIDALSLRGGGTVRLLPGEYRLADSIRLRANIRLLGDRNKTILRRGPLVWSRLARDADLAEPEITPEKPNRFKVGMGLCLHDQQGWSADSRPLTVTSIREGVLHLHSPLPADRLAERGGIVVNHFPMILVEHADGVVLDGLTIDASCRNDAVLRSMRTSVVRFHFSRNGAIRNLSVKNGYGDGILITHASTGCILEDCEVAHNSFYGIHAGSHSDHVIVRRCKIHHNLADGLYVCWGVDHSVFANNDIHHNGAGLLRNGFCIGHKDTDNLIVNNHIHENAKFGISVRRKTESNGAHRNIFRNNLIENNGSPREVFEAMIRRQHVAPDEYRSHAGIFVRGVTHDLLFENNIIRETRKGKRRYQRRGFFFDQGVSQVGMIGNRIEGHPDGAVLDHSA